VCYCVGQSLIVVTVTIPQLTGQIVRLLKNMVLAGYVSEYDVCGITDPFLQIKIIQLLRILGTGSSDSSDEMNGTCAHRVRF